MKRVAAVLGLVATMGVFPTGLAAQGRTNPTDSNRDRQTGGQTTGDRQQLRAELERLRQELQRLQRELKMHEQALRAALRAHDRVAFERHAAAIRHIKDEIERIQRRIRELSQRR